MVADTSAAYALTDRVALRALLAGGARIASVARGQSLERRYLERNGNPYVLSVLDMDGRVGIAYGVYGVPETYLIDKLGVIRFKHVGPLTPELLNQVVLPKVKQWEGA